MQDASCNQPLLLAWHLAHYLQTSCKHASSRPRTRGVLRGGVGQCVLVGLWRERQRVHQPPPRWGSGSGRAPGTSRSKRPAQRAGARARIRRLRLAGWLLDPERQPGLAVVAVRDCDCRASRVGRLQVAGAARHAPARALGRGESRRSSSSRALRSSKTAVIRRREGCSSLRSHASKFI